MKSLTIRQLAQYLGVTKRTVQRRAIKEEWAYQETVGLGGVKRLYTFASLPEAIKSKVIAAIISGHEQRVAHQIPGESVTHDLSAFVGAQEVDIPGGDSKPDGHDTVTDLVKLNKSWYANHSFSGTLDKSELNKEFVMLGLLALARMYVKHSKLGKIKGFDVFCEQFNQRSLHINPAVFTVVSKVSRITLLRWEKKEQELVSDLDSNLPKPVLLDRDMQVMAEEVMMVSPNITARRLRQHFQTFYGDRKIPPEKQLAKWMQNNGGVG